jgi:hypothetical protein
VLVLVLVNALGLVLNPPAVRADEPSVRSSQPQVARHELWLSASATLLLGGITGSFVLKAAALHDRIDLLPLNPRERFTLQEDAVSARRWAWGFGAGASLMALTSLLVLLYQPSLPDGPPAAMPVVSPVLAAGQLGVTCHGRF